MAERRKDTKKRVLKEGEYQRANGTYEFRWRDKTGKRNYIYAKTIDELREKEIDVKRNLLDGVPVRAKELTVNDLYHRWTKLKKGLKENTFQNYKYMYRRFVEPSFGKVKLTEIKRSDVRAFYNSLMDNKGLGISTIDGIHTVIHQVLELGVEDEYLRYNPSDNAMKELMRVRNIETEKRKALTWAQQRLFEEFLAKNGFQSRWWPTFTVMLWTGMRVGELCGLRWEDIDLEKGLISVNHTLVYYSRGDQKCYFGINTTKTDAGTRIIPMLPMVKEAFIAERKFQEEQGLSCNVTVDGYTDFIFINRFGGVQHQGTLNRAIKRIIKECNDREVSKHPDDDDAVLLPPFSNHSLRHTFCTRLNEAGVNIKVIQYLMGHKDIETTFDVYTDTSPEQNAREMANLFRFFNSDLPRLSQEAYHQFTTNLPPLITSFVE